MVKFWEQLDKPSEMEGGLNQQGRQGQSRRQWTHNRRMEKVVELGEAVGIDLVEVHEAVGVQVRAKERPLVSQVVSQLLLGVRDAAGDHIAETIAVVVGCLAELSEKGFDLEGDDSYYSDKEDQGEVDPSIAAKGLGQVESVPILDTLWSRCVPEDLQSRYRKWRTDSGGVGSSDGVGVREMLEALVRDGALSKREGVKEASGKAQVRPKSSEKCAFILNCVKQNKCDGRKPHGFQRPLSEQLRDSISLGGGRKKLYMAKLDLSNCFWSVRLPQQWVGDFSVCVGHAQYVWQSSPFGWKYSPLLCQKLVYSVVRTSIWWLPLLFFVYLDDILIVGTRRFVRKAVRQARHRLQRVGFVLSPRSETEPRRHLDFVGKIFDLGNGTRANRQGMLRGLVRLWLLLVLGEISALRAHCVRTARYF